MSVHAAVAVDGISPTRGECGRYQRRPISRRAESDTGRGYGRDQNCQADLNVHLYEPFSMPLALSVAATFGPERQETSDFPAAALSDFTPAAPANVT
jgi:hypothetical protein